MQELENLMDDEEVNDDLDFADDEFVGEEEAPPNDPLEQEHQETESPTKKRAKKRKREGVLSALKLAHRVDNAAYDAAKAEVEADQREKTKFDLITEEVKADMDSIKAARVQTRRRGKDADKQAAAYNDEIETLAERMTDAYLDDKKANSNGKPALAKIKMLDEVIKMLHRRNPNIDLQLDKDDIDRPIANKNFLKACQQWLQPLPDGTLPNSKVREGILKNLHKLEVDSTVLIESQIGAAIHVLSRHKNELPANKKLCQELITKWSRPIFGLTSDYTALKSIEQPAYRKPTEPSPAKRIRPSEEASASLDSVISGDLLRENRASQEVLWYPRRVTGTADNIRRPSMMSPQQKKQQDEEDEEDDKKPTESATAKQLKTRMSSMKKTKSGGDVRAFSVKLNSIPRARDRK